MYLTLGCLESVLPALVVPVEEPSPPNPVFAPKVGAEDVVVVVPKLNAPVLAVDAPKPPKPVAAVVVVGAPNENPVDPLVVAVGRPKENPVLCVVAG